MIYGSVRPYTFQEAGPYMGRALSYPTGFMTRYVQPSTSYWGLFAQHRAFYSSQEVFPLTKKLLRSM